MPPPEKLQVVAQPQFADKGMDLRLKWLDLYSILD